MDTLIGIVIGVVVAVAVGIWLLNGLLKALGFGSGNTMWR